MHSAGGLLLPQAGLAQIEMLPRRAEILHRFFIVIYYSIDTSCADARASISPGADATA